jgi:hypothetical protein
MGKMHKKYAQIKQKEIEKLYEDKIMDGIQQKCKR